MGCVDIERAAGRWGVACDGHKRCAVVRTWHSGLSKSGGDGKGGDTVFDRTLPRFPLSKSASNTSPSLAQPMALTFSISGGSYAGALVGTAAGADARAGGRPKLILY